MNRRQLMLKSGEPGEVMAWIAPPVVRTRVAVLPPFSHGFPTTPKGSF